jgi:hypothetical protein
VHGRRERQLISNATLPNAVLFLKKIKHNFEYNSLLRGLFSQWIPKNLEKDAGEWLKDQIDISGCSVATGSVDSNLVSTHYGIMIHDDLVNKENSYTKDQLLKTNNWWQLANSLLLPNGVEILIGTRWATDDVYGSIIDKFLQPENPEFFREAPIVELHKGNFHLLQMDCWTDPVKETGSTFPVMFPESKLKELQMIEGDNFPGRYRNDPLAKGRNPFKREWITRWRDLEMPSQRHTMLLIDPSGKAEVTSDYTGCVVVSCGVDHKIYVEHGKRYLITDRALAEWIIENAPIWKPDVIYIEDNKHGVIQDLLELLVGQYIRMGKIEKDNLEYVKTLPYILLEAFPRGRAKEARIRNLTGYVQNGTLLFPGHGAEDLEDEMVRYPSMRDNVIDALAYLLDFMVFPKPTDPPKLSAVHNSREEKEEAEWEGIKEDHKIGERKFDDIDLY